MTPFFAYCDPTNPAKLRNIWYVNFSVIFNSSGAVNCQKPGQISDPRQECLELFHLFTRGEEDQQFEPEDSRGLSCECI